jgi:hypothetical protein
MWIVVKDGVQKGFISEGGISMSNLRLDGHLLWFKLRRYDMVI